MRIRAAFNLNLGVAAIAGTLALAGCGSGLEFNGTSGDTDPTQPRTDAIPHFPLPTEMFSTVEQKWVFFLDVLPAGAPDGVEENVFINGRQAGQQAIESGNLPSDAPNFANPITAPVPLNQATFVPELGTDIWGFDGATLDRNNDLVNDEPLSWTTLGGTNLQHRAGGISFTSQWFMRAVDGTTRLSGVAPEILTYEDADFQSIPVSFTSSPGVAGGFGVPYWNNLPGNKTWCVDPNTQFFPDNASYQQNKVDARVVHEDNQGTYTDEVLTKNESARLWGIAQPAAIGAGASNDPDVNGIHIDWGTGPPPLTFGAWRELRDENFFIESNMESGLADVPSSNYFFASGVGNLPGGLYCNVIGPGNAAVALYLPTAASEEIVVSSYYIGMVMAHVIGLGIGFPESAYSSPGVNDGEEDLMNVNIELDQLFFVAAGRHVQFTSNELLVAMDVVNYPLGSQERFDASFPQMTDDLDPDSIYMKETTPGPFRR